MRRLPAILLLLVSIAALPHAAVGVVSEWGIHEPVRVRLVAPWEVAPREGTLWLGFEVHLAEGWHIYWKNSGDAGFPPTLDIATDPPAERIALRFPAPERYPVPGGLIAIGYEREMIYPLEVEIAAPEAEAIQIEVVADYLVCEEDCIPFHDELRLVLPLGEPIPDPEVAAALARWRERLPRPAEELPGVSVEARRRGHEISLELTGEITPGEETDLFFEPAEGIVLGEPERELGPRRASFRVPIQAADARAGLPETLELAWVVTALGSADEPLAVEGRMALRDLGATGTADRVVPSATDLVLSGMFLALTPSILALLGLVTIWPQRQIRETLGPLSEVWPFVGGGFAGFLALVLVLHFGSRAVDAPLFASPPAVGLTALPSLGFALWLWLGHPTRIDRPRSLGRDLAASLLAPLLALPWVPAASGLAPLATGRGEPVHGALAAAGFAIPFLLLGVFVTLRPSLDPGAVDARVARGLGFLALCSLVWVSYRLLDLTATHRLAFAQLVWLLAALAFRMAATSESASVRWAWWTFAAVCGVGSVVPLGG